MFEVAPNPFVGVEFRGVGRQIFKRQALLVVKDEVSDRLSLVGLEVVPNQDNSAADMAQQVTKKYEDLRRGNCALADKNEKALVGGDAGDG